MADKPTEEMTYEQVQWLALKKPPEEMTYDELQWVVSGEADRALAKLSQEHKPKIHNFSGLKQNRRKAWK